VVVTAAEQLLVEVGYARASTNAIARRAGVSIGSLYQYFSSKEAIFRAVVERHSSEVKPELARAFEKMADGRHDLVNTTLELLRKLAETNAKNPPLMLAIERELGVLGHDHEASMSVVAPVRAIVASRFNLPAKELAVVVELMVETVTHLSRWLIHGKPQGLDTELFIAATGRMLRAILPKSRARRV
jgi:AcrR family transcriptional regulator